ncbi:MAG: suppressor of fused domain protein [Labilithrix sp.]|nr:suppressor of fused domain protein [Labilithrix sp.]MCW5813167.1 suppressor of fused domain protein [Labilithrix sp.]
MARLTAQEMDAVADQLELPVKGRFPITYANHPLPGDPARKLGIQRVDGYPSPGFRTALSYGLAHESFETSNFPDRIELIQGYRTDDWSFERIQVFVADSVVTSNQLPKPGTVYQHAVAHAGLGAPASRMPHALVVYPYLWQRDFYKADVADKRLWFLQLVPIHENELQFITKNGFKVFEELLDHFGMQFHDLNRTSYVDM